MWCSFKRKEKKNRQRHIRGRSFNGLKPGHIFLSFFFFFVYAKFFKGHRDDIFHSEGVFLFTDLPERPRTSWDQPHPANAIDEDQGWEEAPAIRVVVFAPLLHDLCLDCVVISSWINSARRHCGCGVLAVSDRAKNCSLPRPPFPPLLLWAQPTYKRLRIAWNQLSLRRKRSSAVFSQSEWTSVVARGNLSVSPFSAACSEASLGESGLLLRLLRLIGSCLYMNTCPKDWSIKRSFSLAIFFFSFFLS